MDNKISIAKSARDPGEVLAELEGLHQRDARWQDGRVFSLVYPLSEPHTEFLKKAYNLYFHENGLNPGAFPSLQKFESEVVSITAQLLGGGDAAAGSMTSGGSESIMMAVKTYRDHAREVRGIHQPEAILPVTVHPAFDKALHYFGIKGIKVAVDSSYRADVAAMRSHINQNTIFLVASAPQYPHGVMDPVEDLAALALEHQIGLHVDACVGGFMLPWLKKLGYPVPRFDFSVPGVSSMSADLHKYGFTAKGASVVLYRDKALRHFQFFVSSDWPGGLFASPSVTGTRPAGSIAAAWATLQAMGEEGYLSIYSKLQELSKKFQKGLTDLGMQIIGQPVGTLLAYRSPTADIFVIADRLEKKGWFVDRQMNPASIHLTLTPAHLHILDQYLSDLQEAIAVALAHPELAREGMAAMYGMVASVQGTEDAHPFLYQYMDQRYQT